eukprot:SAG31_NODE_94_length_26208_cov_6.281091_15_plen_663_part_00
MQDVSAKVVDLVGKLSVCFAGGTDPDAVQHLQRYAMRILGSRLSPSIVADTYHVGDAIKKKLERQQRSNEVIVVGNQLRKLHSMNTLKQEWAVIYLLHRLSGMPAANSSVFSAVFHSDGLEEVGAAATTPIPSPGEPKQQQSLEAGRGPEPGPSKQLYAHAYKKYYETVNTANEISDSVLLRDLVFVIQGIDGRFVKYNQRADGFVVDPDVGVPRATRDLIHKLGELGWLFIRVKQFVDNGIDNTKLGMVAQSLCAALRDELGEYYRAVAALEAQLSSAAAPGEGGVRDRGVPGGGAVSLRRMLVWTETPIQRFKLMAVLADASRSAALKGGALASTIHSYNAHGDPHTRAFVTKISTKISKPIFAAVRRWMFEGELVDARSEFFVAARRAVPDDRLWAEKYQIRDTMLPTFFPQELAKTVLLIGKAINFLRVCCADTDWVRSFAKTGKAAVGLEYGDIHKLKLVVERSAETINSRLVDIMFTKYKLAEHCRAVKSYILLAKGDFIQYLMHVVGRELDKPASEVSRNTLSGMLETAIRSSSASSESMEILGRLDVRLLQASPGDQGWEVFSLVYDVLAPLNTIFTPAVMETYLRIFNFLWRLKRVEFVLNATWRHNVFMARGCTYFVPAILVFFKMQCALTCPIGVSHLALCPFFRCSVSNP